MMTGSELRLRNRCGGWGGEFFDEVEWDVCGEDSAVFVLLYLCGFDEYAEGRIDAAGLELRLGLLDRLEE